MSGAGDVNGDGFADLIVGARLADPNGISSGESYVVFGFGHPHPHLGGPNTAGDRSEKAAAARPDDPALRYHYAAALAEVGRVDEAREALEALLAGERPFAEAAAAETLLERLRQNAAETPYER